MTSKPDEVNNKKMSFIKRLVSSTTIIFVLLFICLDYLLSTTNPLQYISNAKYMPLSQNSVICKIPQFLSGEANPKLWVIGSSLPMMAIACSDDEEFSTIDASDNIAARKYKGAEYLKQKLKKEIGKSFEIANLTCVGCMASDAELLISKALETGKYPRTIIYGMEPRSFLDNVLAKSGKTPMEQVVTNHRSFTDIYKKNLSWEETRDLLISHVWKFYAAKGDYHTVLLSFACDKLDRSPTIYAAQQKAAATAANREASSDENSMQTSCVNALGQATDPLKADLAVYNIRYNPPNFEQFSYQEKAFARLASLCRRKNISLVVVAMPITIHNRALIDPQILSRYEAEIPALAKKNGAAFLRLDNDKSFTVSDFHDSVHANAKGGKKILDKLVQSLKHENILQL